MICRIRWVAVGAANAVRDAMRDVGGGLLFLSSCQKSCMRDVGRRVSVPQPGDFQGSGNRGKVCCGWVPSSDSVCHSCPTLARQ